MTEEHPNIALLKRLDLRNLKAAKDLFAEDVIWHYFNPNLPDLQGDHVGMDGIRLFFQRVGELSRGTFKAEPVSITPVGDELVMVQVRDTLTIAGKSHARDVVVVWRIVDGRVVEVWDIVPGQPTESSDARH